MKTDHTLPVALLRELVDYNPDTGVISCDGKPLATPAAGHYGRLQVNVGDGRLRYASRVAFAHHHGHWPDGQVDHINGDHTDNRISNLRDLTNAQNAQNRRRPKRNNSTGLLGVTFDPRYGCGRYRARIQVNERMISLGYYGTAEEAHDAYLAAKRELHPFWVEDAA